MHVDTTRSRSRLLRAAGTASAWLAAAALLVVLPGCALPHACLRNATTFSASVELVNLSNPGAPPVRLSAVHSPTLRLANCPNPDTDESRADVLRLWRQELQRRVSTQPEFAGGNWCARNALLTRADSAGFCEPSGAAACPAPAPAGLPEIPLCPEPMPTPTPPPPPPSCAAGVTPPPGTPSLALEFAPADDFDFGALPVGASAERTVTLRNAGGGLLCLNRFAVEPMMAGFDTPGGCPAAYLGPGETCARRVRFTPTATAAYAATLVIETGDTAQPRVTRTLRGRGQGAQLTASADPLCVNNYVAGSSPPCWDASLTLSTSGPGGVSVSQVLWRSGGAAPSATPPARWSVMPAVPPARAVAPGAPLTLQLQVCGAAGSNPGPTLVVISNATNPTLEVALRTPSECP